MPDDSQQTFIPDDGAAAGAMWRLGEQLGLGGTSVVYVATGPSGEQAVLKVLSSHRFEINDAMRERFRREAKTLMRVSDSHVLRALGTTVVNGAPALLLERAAATLRDVARSGRSWPPWLVMRWIREALQGLSALHRAGVVHRDVSTKNLLVGRDGRVLVSDLGASIHADDATVTQHADRLGSLVYISGEQFSDVHGAAPADDIFSMGQVAWELFVGRAPIGNPPALHDARPDVPRPLTLFVESLRAHERSSRPADASAALESLQRALAEVDQEHDARDAQALAKIWFERQTSEAAKASGLPPATLQLLKDLVASLGPVRLAVDSWRALVPPRSYERISLGVGPCDCRRDVAVLLGAGSARFHWDLIETSGFTWTNVSLHNRLTGRGVLVVGFSEDIRLGALEALRESTVSLLEEAFSDRAFMVGAACTTCGIPVDLQVRTDGLSRWPVHRAAICPREVEDMKWRCALCGDSFRREPNSDEWGRYDAVGCRCRGYAFDVAFELAPWRTDSRPIEPTDLMLMERHVRPFDESLKEVDLSNA